MKYKQVSPAKINLFLRVVGKRSDGYHELISLMCPVSLYDRITIQFQTSTMQVISNNPSIPDNENNLAYQAAIKFFNAIDSRDCINIAIEKNIPVGAGLGGGSSNAATVLMALNQWYQSPLSHEKLQQIALSLGADVPFFLQKSTALATGIGECLYPLDLDIKQSLIILYPGFSISTAWAFKNFKIPLTKKKLDDIKTVLISRYKSSQDAYWMTDIHNDLEMSVFSHYPILSEIKKMMLGLGADQSVMSGSGSSIVGIFSDTTSCYKACKQLNLKEQWQANVCHVTNTIHV